MAKAIGKYGFSDTVSKAIRPIVELIAQDKIKEAEENISKLALEVCDNIEKKILPAKQGDDYFTLLDLYIGDNFSGLQLRKEVRDLIMEGMILHDYGKEFGAKLDAMRASAQEVLKT